MQGQRTDTDWGGAFYITAPWAPLITCLLIALLVITGSPELAVHPVIAGTLAGLAVWGGLAFVALGSTRPETANSMSFGQIQDRLRELDSRIANSPGAWGGRSCEEARSQVEQTRVLLATPGSQWARATGYQQAWERIHRAMEALILDEDHASVYADWHRTHARLSESTIGNKTELLKKLDDAKDEWNWSPGKRRQLVLVTRAVHTAVDQVWDKMIRARDSLIQVGIAVGVFGYVLFIIALAFADRPRDAVLAFAVVFLVGALVGLFSRALVVSEADSAAQDYGLEFARRQFVPIAAGVAAVFGVVLTAMLSTSSLSALLTPSAPAVVASGSGATSTGVAAVVFRINSAFDLIQYPGALLVAALFGLTPRLLVDALSGQVERYKQWISSLDPSGAKK